MSIRSTSDNRPEEKRARDVAPEDKGTEDGARGGLSVAPASGVMNGVRLVSSARFVVDALVIPAGVTQRDLPGFVEGEIEYISMFPIDAVAWGYLTTKGKGQRAVLAYAALREQVHAAEDENLHAVLPAFSCLCGLSWKCTTWIFLLEPDCLTLVRFPARKSFPDYVRSCFLPQDCTDELVWALRTSMLEAAPRTDDEAVADGIVRCVGLACRVNRSIGFELQQQSFPGEAWNTWKSGYLTSAAVLMAADVRDTDFLDQERNRSRALRRLRMYMQGAFVLAVLLGTAHVRYLFTLRSLSESMRQVELRRSIVADLEEKNAMIQSTARLAASPMEAFDWLMAMNDLRADTVSFASTGFTRDGAISVSGEAPSVAIVNQYVQSLRDAGQYASVEVRDMQSTQRGVNFTLVMQVAPGAQFAEGGAE